MKERVSRVTAPETPGAPEAPAGTEAVDGRASRWVEHRAARREELIDAAMAAINEFGSEVGMEQIAAAANTSKPVIYRYFSDKTDLYRAVGVRVVGRIVAALESAEPDADPRSRVRAAIDAYLTLLDDNPELFRFVTHNRLLSDRPADGSDPAGAGEFSSSVAAVLTAALAQELRVSGLDPAAARPWGEAAIGFIRAASIWWLDHPQAMTRPQLTDYLSALLWGGAAGVFQSAGRDVDARPSPGVFQRLTAPGDATDPTAQDGVS